MTAPDRPQAARRGRAAARAEEPAARPPPAADRRAAARARAGRRLRLGDRRALRRDRGRLRKQDRVSVVPQVSGRDRAGDGRRERRRSKAGQTLFTLDAAVYRSMVEQDRAKLESARLERREPEGRLRAGPVRGGDRARRARDRARPGRPPASLLRSGVVRQATADDSALEAAAGQGALARPRARCSRPGGARRQPRHRDRPITRRCCEALASCARPSSTSRTPSSRARADGVVSQTARLQQGQYVTPAVPVLTLVATDGTWIEANYKETDLTHMQPGQAVEVTPRHLSRPPARGRDRLDRRRHRLGVRHPPGAERQRQLGQGRAARAGADSASPTARTCRRCAPG